MHDANIAPAQWLAATTAIACLIVATGKMLGPLTQPASLEHGVILACWWVSAAMGMWFGVSVAIWTLTLRTPGRAVPRTLSRFVMPGARKFAESTFALTLMVSSAACSVGDTNDAPTLSLMGTVTTQLASTSEPLTSVGPAPTAPTTTVPETTSSASSASSTVPPSTADPTPPKPTSPPATEIESERSGSYEVSAGDSLWTIAKAQVSMGQGTDPTAAQIAHYWKELVALNRDAILSGNPDLIYPGEFLLLRSPSTANSSSRVE